MLDKTEDLIMLYDFYGPLLTERQQQAVQLYYEADLSLSEVAEEMSISRQAVFDILRRTGKVLKEYELKLGLVDKFKRQREAVANAYQFLNRMKNSNAAEIMPVIKILEEILEMDSEGSS